MSILKSNVRIFICILYLLTNALTASSKEPSDTAAIDSVKPRAWLAAVESVGLTGMLMVYNNVVLFNSPFAKVTIESTKRNLTEFKWWWDLDYMYTNTIEHPYHGSIYYLSARENGLGMGASSLFAVGGSLLWELVGEKEEPSYNDMITTPIGGVTIGEPLHRISSNIIDERAMGLERVGREVLAFIVNPMCGLNRLLRGDSWRVRGGVKESHLLTTTLSSGYRYLTVKEQPNVATAYLNWNSKYGDIMGAEGNGLFDYFDINFTAAIGSHQTMLNYARVTSQLWRSEGVNHDPFERTWGIYNHLYHVYAEPDYDIGDYRKFRNCVGYSEIGAAGLGFSYRVANTSLQWEQQLFVNGILLGATPMKLVDRQHPKVGYSWGSGYGAKAFSHLRVGQWLHVGLDVDGSQLFTWKGYECKDATDLNRVSIKNIQGEAGNSLTFIATPTVELWPCRSVGLELRGRHIWHKFNYLHHQHTTLNTAERSVGIIVKL